MTDLSELRTVVLWVWLVPAGDGPSKDGPHGDGFIRDDVSSDNVLGTNDIPGMLK